MKNEKRRAKNNMDDIKVLNQRQINRTVKLIGFFLGTIILATSIYSLSMYGIVSGILIIGALILQKNTLIDEHGITVIYDAIFYKYREVWRFDEISELHRETSKISDHVALHFLRGSMSKRLIFTKNDALHVINMARRVNRKIHFSDVD